MPPKAKRKAKAAAKPVDPVLKDATVAVKKARAAQDCLAEIDEDDPKAEEESEKASEALIEAVRHFTTVTDRNMTMSVARKVRTIRRVPVHDAQMVKLRLLVSIRQARIPQAQEATSAPCTEGDVHDSANAVADLSSAILGLQVSKAWAPSTEHNEEAQNKRMAYPMDLSRNENELDDDKFTPYVEGTKIHEHVLDDGTFMYIDSKTGKQVKDQHGTPLDLPKQATGAGDETVADGGDEEGEKDGNGDDTRDVDNEDAPSGSETAGTMGPVLNAKPPATNAKKPEFLTMGFCIDCSGVTPTDELFTHYRADISKDVVQCMDCQKAEDERTNTAICRKCLYRWYPQYFVDPSRPGHCNLCTGHMLL